VLAAAPSAAIANIPEPAFGEPVAAFRSRRSSRRSRVDLRSCSSGITAQGRGFRSSRADHSHLRACAPVGIEASARVPARHGVQPDHGPVPAKPTIRRRDHQSSFLNETFTFAHRFGEDAQARPLDVDARQRVELVERSAKLLRRSTDINDI
jgi:hypothetical protein